MANRNEPTSAADVLTAPLLGLAVVMYLAAYVAYRGLVTPVYTGSFTERVFQPLISAENALWAGFFESDPLVTPAPTLRTASSQPGVLLPSPTPLNSWPFLDLAEPDRWLD